MLGNLQSREGPGAPVGEGVAGTADIPRRDRRARAAAHSRYQEDRAKIVNLAPEGLLNLLAEVYAILRRHGVVRQSAVHQHLAAALSEGEKVELTHDRLARLIHSASCRSAWENSVGSQEESLCRK